MTPKQRLYVILPVIAVFMVILTYLQLFSTAVIAILVVLYLVVSLRNRRKFAKQENG